VSRREHSTSNIPRPRFNSWDAFDADSLNVECSRMLCRFLIGLSCLLFTSEVFAVIYEVGPHKKLSALAQVPWESLNASDEVHIFWREEPYREKFVLCRQGRAGAPIVVRGMPGPKGELPVIDGENATTRTNLRFWGDIRGVIKIGGATVPPDTIPQHIVIERLDVRGGRQPFAFKAAEGSEKKYNRNAAALYVEKAQDLVVRNCILRDSGNGLFISSNDQRASSNILVEGCHIYDNGNRSGLEHNVYTAAREIVFQYNHIGPPKTNAAANSLKDRSSGTVVRYNWLEGGYNILDLVDGEDSAVIRKDPQYGRAFVYGNVIINRTPVKGYIVHFGGDSPHGEYYRKGPLYFFNNTVVSYRPDWIVFRGSGKNETYDCRNNIFYTVPPKKAAKMAVVFSNNAGSIALSHNWCSETWRPCQDLKKPCFVTDDGTSIHGVTPGFANEGAGDFRLTDSSSCINAAGILPKGILPEHDVAREFNNDPRSRNRAKEGKLDIGAFEFSR
jgi:hypothetical protein